MFIKQNNNLKGFIQIPILIAILVGVLVVGGAGYIGVKQSQNHQTEKIQKVEIATTMNSIQKNDKDTEINKSKEKIQTEAEQGPNKQTTLPASSLLVASNSYVTSATSTSAFESIYSKEFDKFLSNPTVESLKIFCEEAKNIPSLQTKEVLSEDKTTIKKVSIPLSEVSESCKILSTPILNYTFIISASDSLLVTLDDSDGDQLRIDKIKHNELMKEYDKKYKLYGYYFCGYPPQSEAALYPIIIDGGWNSNNKPTLGLGIWDNCDSKIIIPEAEIGSLIIL